MNAHRMAPWAAVLAAAVASSIPATASGAPGAPRPAFVVASTREVRAIALCGRDAWIASRGGVERYEVGTWTRALLGVDDGLDTLDARGVRCDAKSGAVEVRTATGVCERRGEGARFVCQRSPPPAPGVARTDVFHGTPVTARVEVDGGAIVGTAADGAFFVPESGEPVRLGPPQSGPSGFARAAVPFRGRIFVATFADGLYATTASAADAARDPTVLARAERIASPFRMVNDLVEAGGALWVAANEGLFVTTDGAVFERVARVDARGVTGIASHDGRTLWVTTTSALWKIRAGGRARGVEASWWRPAGTRSLQGVGADASGVWLASEDRGAIRFDGRTFTAYDRLAGLPTSWVVGIAADGAGGVFAATLRDGVLHVAPDGTWENLRGAPSDWTLSVARLPGLVCVGTQSGAACAPDARAELRALAGLPDARAHGVVPLADAVVVGTEAGLAVYSRAALAGPDVAPALSRRP